MYVKKLILKNFQKHSHLELDLVKGVNILYGSSDAGKSCIRRAFGFLFFGDPKSDRIRKEGTKQTSVIAILDNNVEVERVKSASINRYLVRVPGTDEVPYDAIGGGIPEEVAKILQVSTINIDKEDLNLNIADQIALPFLTDKSGTFRLKLFNKLTGQDVLDKVSQAFNKELLQISKDMKIEKEFIEKNQPDIGKLETEIIAKKKINETYEENIGKINLLVEQYQKVNDLKNKLEENTKNIKQAEERLKNVKFLDQSKIDKLKKLIKEYLNLKEFMIRIETNQVNIYEVQERLKRIKTPVLNLDLIKANILKLQNLKSLSSKLLSTNLNLEKSTKVLDEVISKIEPLNELYKAKLKEMNICPVCKTQMTEEHINKVHL